MLLNRFDQDAQQTGFKVAFMEASDDGTFVTVLVGRVRRILLELDRLGALSQAVKRALRVFNPTFRRSAQAFSAN